MGRAELDNCGSSRPSASSNLLGDLTQHIVLCAHAEDLLEPGSAVGGRPDSLSAGHVSGASRHSTWPGVLEAGAGWGARADCGWLGRALSILVSVITCGWSRRARLVVKMADVVVAVPGEAAVEVVLPEGRGCLQLSWPGWSWVV